MSVAQPGELYTSDAPPEEILALAQVHKRGSKMLIALPLPLPDRLRKSAKAVAEKRNATGTDLAREDQSPPGRPRFRMGQLRAIWQES